MKKCAFWIASFLSALTAIFSILAAVSNASNRDQNYQRSMKLNVSENQKQIFLDEAHHLNHTVNNLIYAGVAVAILSATCLFVSERKKEPAVKYSIVIVILLAVYLVFLFAAIR
jgi:glycerol uptake facilitator-like aquaporin